MSAENAIDAIIACVTAWHSSPHAPVKDGGGSQYNTLIKRLQKHYAVHDNTETHTLLSSVLHLKAEESLWLLRLSHIGPYAVVMRLNGSRIEVVDPNDDIDDSETDILRAVYYDNYTLLGRQTLERTIPLPTDEQATADVCVYRALFSDSDFLPWQ